MPKQQISDMTMATRLINHGPVLLVSVAYKTSVNVLTVGWNMPLSRQPPLIGLAIAQRRYSHDMIRSAQEFVVNIPTAALLREIEYSGAVSGASVDKNVYNTFIFGKPARTASPLIDQCPVSIECAVSDILAFGDHSIFIGEPLAIWVDPDVFDGYWRTNLPAGRTLHHLGGRVYSADTNRYDASDDAQARALLKLGREEEGERDTKGG